ncbi:MAG: thioredoxin:protein disulfide reductase [Acidobacteriota bacterium]|nr:thioredoxin:protein disulfide reductase [Acidobacteriota bacterium]
MRRSLSFLLLLLAAVPAFAQIGASGPPPLDAQLVELSGSITARNGAEIRGVVSAKITDGWHINSAKPLESYAIKTVLSFDGADLVSAEYPAHTLHEFTFSAGTKLAVYQGTIQIPFVAKLKGDAKTIAAKLHYQACNDSVCLPPRDASAEISTVPSVAAGASPAASAGAADATPKPNFTPLSAAPANAKPVDANDKVASTFAAYGLPLTLLVLFLGGLALNLTPCVLPMLPITLGFFAMQSDGRRSRRFLLSVAYVLGIVVMYASLGVVAALSGKLFGAWLQNPLVLIGLSILMLVLASSMFGAWEMTVPQFIANRSQGRAGMAGAAMMGLFVGIVAAPCVGPIVAALFILVASIGKPLIGFAMFGALGFGLGFPYLAALTVLPKPGEWMVQVKKALGFILVAEAFYFVRPLIGDDIYRWGVAISLLVGAVFLFFVKTHGARALRIGLATLLLVAGVAFAIPNRQSAVVWQPYDASAIAKATASGKPVIIDFYADWCLPCKELDEKTFSDKRVAAELDRFVRVKGNLTVAEDAKTKALTRQYGIVGVPTIVLIDAGGHEVRAARLTGFEPPEKFLARIAAVK